MTRVGPRLRAAAFALRVRWVEQVEAERDEARQQRDEARELRGISERAREHDRETVNRIDDQVAETERVLVACGYPHPGGGENLAKAVDDAIEAERQRLEDLVRSVWRSVDKPVSAADVRTSGEALEVLREHIADARRGQVAYERTMPALGQILGSSFTSARDDELLSEVVRLRDGSHSRWRGEIATLLDVQAEGSTDSDLLATLKKRFGGGGPGTVLDAWRQVCRLVDSEGFLSPASIVDRVAVLAEQQATRCRCAYDVAAGSTTGVRAEPCPVHPDAPATTTLTFGNELGDWQAPAAESSPEAGRCRDCGTAHPLVLSHHADPRRYLEYCNGGGRSPAGTPDVDSNGMPYPAPDEEPTRGVARSAYDVDGDVFPPPGRPARDDGVVDAQIMCRFFVDGVPCGGADGHPGGCWPDRQALARCALIEGDIVDGVVAAAAAQVLEDAHLLADRGMTVDGDLLAEVISESVPRRFTDDEARAIAERALDAAVRTGMTVLHGPDLVPRAVADECEVPF